MQKNQVQYDAGTTQPLWLDNIDVPVFDKLEGTHEADVCVVGAGIAGLSVAYQLLNEGQTVIVVDDHAIGSGETGRTSAHLSCVMDDGFQNLEKQFGEEKTRLAVQSHKDAIDTIERISAREKIDCDFKRMDAILFNDSASKGIDLDKELEAAHRAGLTQAKKMTKPAFLKQDCGPVLSFPYEAVFHPMKYLSGLARTIEKKGGRIFGGTRVKDWKEKDGFKITTTSGNINATIMIAATNAPITNFVTHTRMVPYRSYVIALACDTDTLSEHVLYDTQNPYHYMRPYTDSKGRRYFILGGEDHRTGTATDMIDAAERFQKLEAWAKTRFDGLGDRLYEWSGQIMEPTDSLAYIGRSGKSESYIMTGDSGHGLTHGVLGAKLIADLIMKRANPLEDIYSPYRLPHGGFKELAAHTAFFIGDFARYILPAEVDDVDLIPPGEGAIMQNGMSKKAVYRDQKGELHEFSAVCTHLACIIKWNGLEKSWDCPCHGSRFAPDGHVLNGPTEIPLKRL